MPITEQLFRKKVDFRESCAKAKKKGPNLHFFRQKQIKTSFLYFENIQNNKMDIQLIFRLSQYQLNSIGYLQTSSAKPNEYIRPCHIFTKITTTLPNVPTLTLYPIQNMPQILILLFRLSNQYPLDKLTSRIKQNQIFITLARFTAQNKSVQTNKKYPKIYKNTNPPSYVCLPLTLPPQESTRCPTIKLPLIIVANMNQQSCTKKILKYPLKYRPDSTTSRYYTYLFQFFFQIKQSNHNSIEKRTLR
eukprot:TRINITY_DN4787_c0_g1_i2.p2 TRINITY_DN4787_c0_g1~~TRINITY_DN4787_c0_g1_i2.p2  ORF type:complete len:247 (+),score=-10.12 TRINITY_DN4787_c0_g1_i2:451-1191(+)